MKDAWNHTGETKRGKASQGRGKRTFSTYCVGHLNECYFVVLVC